VAPFRRERMYWRSSSRVRKASGAIGAGAATEVLGGQEQEAVELLESGESEGRCFLQDCGGPAMGGAQL
jgi:hypothetical protein